MALKNIIFKHNQILCGNLIHWDAALPEYDKNGTGTNKKGTSSSKWNGTATFHSGTERNWNFSKFLEKVPFLFLLNKTCSCMQYLLLKWGHNNLLFKEQTPNFWPHFYSIIQYSILMPGSYGHWSTSSQRKWGPLYSKIWGTELGTDLELVPFEILERNWN